MRALALLLALTACSSDAEEAAAVNALDAQLTSATIDGRPAPAKRTPDRLEAIPDAFRGRWSVGGDCGQTSDQAIVVARDTLSFSGSVGDATYILRAGPRAISLELAKTGKVETESTSMTLSMTPDDHLRRADPDGTEVLYARCSGPAS